MSQTINEHYEEADNIINNIIRVRKRKHISQYRLAEMCNIPQATVSRVESFSSEPKLSTIVKICKVLGLKIECIDLNKEN